LQLQYSPSLIHSQKLLISLEQHRNCRKNEYMKETQPIPTGQQWNAEAYATSGRFVANLASDVVRLLAPQPGERILDIGCGDGALTEQIAATGATVIGIDNSTSMVEAARKRSLAANNSFEVALHHADALPYQQEFDAVFSNAALHWLPAEKHPATLAGIHRALRPGSRFVAEKGGQGNIAAIRVALHSVLAPYGIDAEAHAASFYPAPSVYRRLLEAAGFRVESIELIPRPTPLPEGSDGTSPMATWLNTFRNGVLDQLTPTDRARVIDRTVTLLKPALCTHDGNWFADYVRLRFHATKL
jgi:trans-aconitate methyltransferase